MQAAVIVASLKGRATGFEPVYLGSIPSATAACTGIKSVVGGDDAPVVG